MCITVTMHVSCRVVYSQVTLTLSFQSNTSTSTSININI